MAPNINVIVFDLDGTLIDSLVDIELAINATLKHYGCNEIPLRLVATFIGHGARYLVEKAFAASETILSEMEFKHAIKFYIDYYRNNPVVRTSVYPGVMETLNHLRKNKIKMGICSNKPGVMTHLILKKLKLDPYFSAVIAGDEVEHPKPHQDHLFAVLNQLKFQNTNAVMIGDSDIDLTCARLAGIPFIGVSYGYGNLSACHLIHHFSELSNAIGNLNTYA